MLQFVSALNNRSNKETVNVFILTGQSNSLGFALNTSATTEELSLKTNFKIWSKINSQFEDLLIGTNNLTGSSNHGIELGLAKYFNSYYRNETGYLIKWGVGSTEIVKHLQGGEVYTELWSNYVKPAINSIINSGKNCRVHIIFAQGEADANTNNPPPKGEYTLYGGRFDTWISLWQSNFGINIPIVNYELLAVLPSGYEWAAINSDYTAKSTTEENYSVLDTKDLGNVGDNIHYDYAAHKSASLMAYDFFATHKGYLQTELLT